MATLTLTDLDKELLDGLRVLTDQEIGRVQAHLAAGLPMRKSFGWEANGAPSCFGCLVGTAMSHDDAIGRASEIDKLALETFLAWVNGQGLFSLFEALPQPILDRLAALLDMEWSRRHPFPAESPLLTGNLHPQPSEISTAYGQEAILPTLKEAVLAHA